MASVTSSLPGSGSGNIRYTSDLINDGEFPEDGARFIEDVDLPSLVGDIIVVDGLGDKHKIIEIDTSSTVWDKEHDLEKVCSVRTVRHDGAEIVGVVTINDGNRVQIKFNTPVKGQIILN